MTSSNLVPDWCKHGCPPPDGHKCDAKLVLIGEAPGRWEDTYLKPFVGPAGRELDKWWADAGLKRSDFYITNVFPYRPPANKIEAIGHQDIAFWTARLRERLAQLADPVVIVPTGNTALQALFGQSRSISDWRGSITSVSLLDGRSIKCIPTIHPAATFRQPILTKFCRSDWKRIAHDSTFKELNHPLFDICIEPTEDEFGQFLLGLADTESTIVDGVAIPPALATDIECDINTKELLCVGFSYDGMKAVVMPLTKRAILSQHTLERMWYYARKLCGHSISKVLQNGQFDAYLLLQNTIPLINYDFDLMELDHAYDPNDGGDVEAGDGGGASDDGGIRISMRNLAVLNSLYGNRQPFWKHTGKQMGDFNLLDLFRYNGVDNCCTWACYPTLYSRLALAGKI